MSVIGVGTQTNIAHDKQVWECIAKFFYGVDNWRLRTISISSSTILHRNNIRAIFRPPHRQLMSLYPPNPNPILSRFAESQFTKSHFPKIRVIYLFS